MLDALVLLVRRTLRKSQRRPVLFTFSFVQPLWWLLLFGSLFGRALPPEARLGLEYRSFVTPGISLLAVLFGASQAGIGFVRDAQTGMLMRVLHTATSAPQILFAKLAADVARLIVMALAVLLLGVILGAELRPEWSALPIACLTLCAFSALVASASCVVGALAREPEAMGAYVHVVNMPILFTSTALVPTRMLPAWLAWFAHINPLSTAAQAWRGLWLSSTPPTLAQVGALSLFALAAFCAAVAALARARTMR